MKKKSFDNKGLSGLKRSSAGKCLAYFGSLGIVRPMIAMLLITVLLSSATVTKAQIKVSREANKYIQIGAKVLGMMKNPYVKAFGGAVGFLFAEEKLPEYAELKESLEKEWLLDIDDKSKENYKTFIEAKKIGYRNALEKINLFKENSNSKALEEAQNLSTLVYADIPLFHQNKEKKPYPAGPTLPYLFAAMCLDLDLLKLQIEWGQEKINEESTHGDEKSVAEARGRRDATIAQYNKERLDFWQLLQKEIVRAKVERDSQVIYLYQEDGKKGWYFSVRDKYYGREDVGYTPNLKYYDHIENSLFTSYSSGDWQKGEMMRIYAENRVKARTQITIETNSYDLSDYGYYGVFGPSNDRFPQLYSCDEKIRANLQPVGTQFTPKPVLHLVCPLPGDVAVVEGELSPYETADLKGLLVRNWNRYPPRGAFLLRYTDGTLDFRHVDPELESQKVTNTEDGGPGSLREAIENGGEINVDAIQGQTITLTSGPLYIYARDVKIMANDLKQPIKIVGPSGDKIFVISGGTKLYNGDYLTNIQGEDGKDMKCGKTSDGKVTNCPADEQ